MKVKIKTFNGELPSYLTLGKVYDAVKDKYHNGYDIIDDDNDENNKSFILLNYCAHLNGGS